jgi:hypothetical protein
MKAGTLMNQRLRGNQDAEMLLLISLRGEEERIEEKSSFVRSSSASLRCREGRTTKGLALLWCGCG